MKQLPLRGSDKPALIDDEDYDRLKVFDWSCLRKDHKLLRVVRYHKLGPNRCVKKLLHLEVLQNVPKDKVVDHIDNDVLNNQKSNLRICTRQENSRNRSLNVDNTSGYKGVTFHKAKNKYAAVVTLNKESRHLGYFVNPEEAAKAYNVKALELFGEFANINDLT